MATSHASRSGSDRYGAHAARYAEAAVALPSSAWTWASSCSACALFLSVPTIDQRCIAACAACSISWLSAGEREVDSDRLQARLFACAARRFCQSAVSSGDGLAGDMRYSDPPRGSRGTMPSAATHGDEEHSAGLADLGGVPHPLGYHGRSALAERHFAKAARLLQQQHGRPRQQVDELVGLGMHFPVRPVRGARKLADEPAGAEAIELGLGQGPEGLAATDRRGRSGRTE